MALGWQTLEAKKTRKPLEQDGALEQVGERMKRVMGLTLRFSGGPRSGPSAATGCWAFDHTMCETSTSPQCDLRYSATSRR